MGAANSSSVTLQLHGVLLAGYDVADGHTLAIAIGGGAIPVAHAGRGDHHVALAEQLLGLTFFLIVGLASEHHQGLRGSGVVVPGVAAAALKEEVGGELMLAAAQYRDVDRAGIVLGRGGCCGREYRGLRAGHCSERERD